jgi:signal transduction histidine kinase
LGFQAEYKHIRIEVELEKDLPAVKADAEKTVWVLINFLNNAIRHSNENSRIIVSVAMLKGMVRFSVQDFGKGIASEYQGKLFEKFFQVPGAKQSGTGLGLAISKEFILAENGNVGLSSKENKGSTFYFELHPIPNIVKNT